MTRDQAISRLLFAILSTLAAFFMLTEHNTAWFWLGFFFAAFVVLNLLGAFTKRF